MDKDKTKTSDQDDQPAAKPETDNDQPASDSQAPADALSRTPEDLEQEQAEQMSESDFNAIDADEAKRKASPLKRFFKRINVYLLGFLLLIIVAGAVTVVNYLNSQKAEPKIDLATQELTDDALQQLANRDASVGDNSQTLTIKGNAIISGQTLTRGNLNVAGNIQSGGSLQGTSLTISGSSNLGETQANNLQVATNLAVQGDTTLRNLNVAGSGSFSGELTASQITVTRLILSGNASLEVPNHISFTGPSPSRTINAGVLGAGGSASVNGSDTTGTVNINTGNNPSAGCFARINFNQAFSRQPHVIISPVGAGAGMSQYYVDRNNSGFSICTASPAPANQAFAFDYFVTG